MFIYGDNLDEVLEWTVKALTRLAKAGFMVNLRKSKIGVLKGQVLGHLWCSGGYFGPVPDKLIRLAKCSDSELARMSRPMLYGLLNWFKPYLPDFAIRAEPLR